MDNDVEAGDVVSITHMYICIICLCELCTEDIHIRLLM